MNCLRLLWISSLVILLTLGLGRTSANPNATPDSVRVGVYQNAPKVLIDRTGQPQGFWVDLVTAIAAAEDWTLTYVPCTWEQCLSALEQGQLDLMVDVAYSAERDRRFDFNQEVVLSSWSVVYTRPEVRLNSILDLDQRRVGVLRDSIQLDYLRERSQDFDIAPAFVEADDFDTIFRWIQTGVVDAGMVNRFWGADHELRYGVSRTNILGEVSQLFFAVPSGATPDLRPALDRHLTAFKADPDSIYYQSLQRWLETDPRLRVRWRDVAWISLGAGVVTILILTTATLWWNRRLQREMHQRQRLEQGLRRSEQRYRQVVEAQTDFILRSQPDTTITFVNDAFCQAWGFTLEAVIGQKWLSLTQADEARAATLAQIAQLTPAQPSFLTEHCDRRADGSWGWTQWLNQGIFDASGTLVELQSVGRDITALKQAQLTLQDREAFLQSIYNYAQQSIFIVDVQPDGAFRFVGLNPIHERLTGLSTAAIQGKTPAELFPPAIAQALEQHYQDCVDADRPISYEEYVPFQDRDWWWLTTLAPLKDETGRIYRLIGTATDITDRKAAENRLQTLTDNMPGVIYRYVLHADGTDSLPFISPGCIDLWEFDAATLMADLSLVWAMVHPPDMVGMQASIAHSEATLSVWVWEWRIIPASGQVRWLQAAAKPHRLLSGDIVWDGLILDISDRKQAEVALAAVQERYHLAIQGIGEGIWDWDFRTQVITVSDRYWQFLGYDPQHPPLYSPEQALAWVHPDDRALVQQAVQNHLDHGQPFELEYRKQTQSGAYIWVRSRGEAVRDEQGQPLRMVGAIADITQRKAAAAALAASEQRFHNLAANVPGAIFRYLLHPDGTDAVDYMSPGCVDLWEVPATAVIDDAQLLWDMVHPDDRAAISASVLASAQTLQPWSWQWRIITPSGRLKWLEASGRPERYPDGTIAWDTLITDVSDRKQAQWDLIASEERFRLVTENMSDLVCLHDPAGLYLYVTPSCHTLLGYSPDKLVGCNPLDLCHPADRLNLAQHMAQAAQAEHPLPITYRLRQQSGTYIWLETLTKPIVDAQGQVMHLQTTSRDVSDRMRMEEKLRYEALHDTLTGLPNRSLLMERLDLALKRMHRHPQAQFAVLFLDLDNFKVINDSLGHIVGDQLLITVAESLLQFIRETDVAARLGGDEFVILLEEMEQVEDALLVADRIAATLRSPLHLGGREIFVTTSIGIVLSSPTHTRSADLLRDADIAMYRAKSNGRAQYALFDPTMHYQMLKRLHLETDLRQALEHGEFVLYYQPIVALKTSQIEGFEALIRWQHPDRGLISPQEFITVAEETGLIGAIGRWALQTACAQLVTWRQLAHVPATLKISVNLSPKQLNTQLITDVEQILHTTGLPGSNLTLEVTESILVQDLQATYQWLTQLKAKGIRISIDDFGTGYSSLSYLHQLPVDILKVDRSFVTQLAHPQTKHSLVATIITLSQVLDLVAIAEGIETLEQLKALQSLGCAFGQGYFFAKPVDVATATQLLSLPALAQTQESC